MDPILIWLLIAAVFLAAEVLLMAGFGFLFGGIAAFCTGLLIEFKLVNAEQFDWQIGTWFVLTGVFAALLWKPIKKFRVNTAANGSFENMVGTHAIVINAPLKAGVVGQVKWSGTQMNAILESGQSDVQIDQTVTITAVKGNILHVKPL